MAATKATTHGDRIAALEEAYRGIGREVGGLRDDFKAFATEVRKDLAVRSRTQWSPLIGAASLVVAVIGGLVTLGAQGPLRDIARHDAEISRMRTATEIMSGNRFTASDGARMWEAIRTIEDEDFDRGEAELMYERILALVAERDAGLRREMDMIRTLVIDAHRAHGGGDPNR